MVSQDYNGVRINWDRIKQVPSFFMGPVNIFLVGKCTRLGLEFFLSGLHINALFV